MSERGKLLWTDRSKVRWGDPAAKFAGGEVVVVWIDHARGVSLPLPQALLKLIS